MKKEFVTCLLRARGVFFKAVQVLVSGLFFSTLALAQEVSASQITGDLTTMAWKTATDVNSVLDQELVQTDSRLTEPNLAADDRYLLLSYRRLVSYVQAGIQADQTLDQAILKGYDQVLSEAKTDPAIKGVQANHFVVWVNNLVEILTEVPAAVTGQ